MISTGMIFQFDSVQGTGLIMLSDGEKKEFSTDEWADESTMPSVGLKISYESTGPLVKIKMASEIEIQKKVPNELTSKEEELASFTSIEEFQRYFSEKGFDVIKNTDEGSDDGLSMGKFFDEGVHIISISFKDAKAELSEKTIQLLGMDDHIQYFKDTGYRLINDSEENGSRKAILRKYVMDQHSEIILKSSDDNVTVIKTVNGKNVRLNKA